MQLLHIDSKGHAHYEDLRRSEVLRLAQEAAKVERPHEERKPLTPRKSRLQLLSPGSYFAVQAVHARDLRKLDAAFAANNDPCLIVRKQAILISTDLVRAIILKDACYAFTSTDGDKPLSTLKAKLLELLGEKESEGTAFEFRSLEAVLYTVCNLLSNDCERSFPKIMSTLERLAQSQISAMELDTLRSLKNTINDFGSQVEGIRRVLMEFLDNDGDLRLLYLTLLYEDPNVLSSPLPFDPEVAEALLESYLQEIHTIRTKIRLLQQRIQNTESLVMIKLDSTRNHLLTVDVVFSLVTLSLSSGTFRVHARDIRKLHNAFSVSSEPSIELRNQGVLINADPLRTIIMRHCCLVFVPDGADSFVLILREMFSEVTQQDTPDVAFEFKALEALLGTLCRFFKMDFERTAPVISAALDKLASGKISVRELEALREYKNTMQEFELQVDGVRRALMEILDDEEDMRLLYLTNLDPSLLQDLYSFDSEDVEVLIENYLQDIFSTRTKATLLQHRIQNTESLVMLKLDSMRNYLLGVDVFVSIVTIAISVGTFIAGVFGMNLKSHLENTEGMFWGVTGVMIALMVVISVWGWLYFRRKGVFMW